MLPLLAALALLQQDTAEQTFARIEQALVKAKSVKIKGKVKLSLKGQELTLDATALLKEGDKAKIALSGGRGNPWFVSDGRKVTVDAFQAQFDGAVFDTPKDFNIRVSTALARKGFLDVTELARRIRAYDLDPREKTILTVFKFGDPDGDLKTLTYVLREGRGTAQVKIWYHPTDLTIKKRTMVFPDVAQSTVTETYDTFALNEDVPDASFKP